MVKEYEKIPFRIKAIQWTGSMKDVIELVGHDLPTYGPLGQSGSLRISTLEGEMECRVGDWIIRGVKGEFYPCKPDIFAMSYRLIDRTAE